MIGLNTDNALASFKSRIDELQYNQRLSKYFVEKRGRKFSKPNRKFGQAAPRNVQPETLGGNDRGDDRYGDRGARGDSRWHRDADRYRVPWRNQSLQLGIFRISCH